MDANAIEPYKALIVAMLDQAIRDFRNGRPDVRQTASRWLQYDQSCAEFCNIVGLNHEALTEALDRERQSI